MKTEILRVDSPLGVDETLAPSSASAENIVNMRYDRLGVWKTCGGYKKISAASGAHEVARRTETMSWFSTRNGARDFVVVEVKNADKSTRLYHLDWTTGASSPNLKTLSAQDASRESLINRAYNSGPWQKTQYLSSNGWLYIINGVDEPLRFDGLSVERVGFSGKPAAPIAQGPREGFFMYDLVYADICKNIPTYADPMQVGVGIAEQTGADAIFPNDSDEAFVDVHQLCEARAWLYGYAYTWVNDLGEESQISPTVWVYGDNVTGDLNEPRVTSCAHNADSAKYAPTKVCVSLTIPKPPAEVRGIRVYRTKNTFHKTRKVDDDAEGLDSATIPYSVTAQPPNANKYFHSEYPMGGELSIVDSKGDQELGSKYDRRSKGPFPTGAKFCASFKGTLFLAAKSDYPDRVYYSAPLRYGQFPQRNFFAVGDRDSGQITGMYATKNCIVVFKQRGIYLIKGDPVTGFTTETLTEDVGCMAPNAIVEIPGPELKTFAGKPLGLLFLSDSGPHILHGVLGATGTPTSIEYIGKSIGSTWDKLVSKSQLMMSQACVNYRDEEVWIQVPTGADVDASKTMVYHYALGAWSFRETYPAMSLCSTENNHQHIFFGGNEASPGLYVYSYGHDQNGTAIKSEYTTSPHDFKKRAHVAHFEPLLMSTGRAVDVNIKKDRRVTFDRATANSKDAVDSEYTADKWGTAEWDANKIWYDYMPVPVRYDLHAANQRKLTIKATSSKLEMVSYDLHLLPSRKSIKKLDVNG